MTTLTETQLRILHVLADRRDRGMAVASFNHIPDLDERDACVATSTLRVFVREGLATGLDLIDAAFDGDLDPIDQDDDGEFSAEFVRPVLDDPEDWDVDRWTEMSR